MARHRNQGFTLLELMVVLLILGLGAAVATPALVRLADALAERNQQDQVVMLLQNLPVGVMKQGGGVLCPLPLDLCPIRKCFREPRHHCLGRTPGQCVCGCPPR